MGNRMSCVKDDKGFLGGCMVVPMGCRVRVVTRGWKGVPGGWNALLGGFVDYHGLCWIIPVLEYNIIRI